jgi:hypothetical protein
MGYGERYGPLPLEWDGKNRIDFEIPAGEKDPEGTYSCSVLPGQRKMLVTDPLIGGLVGPKIAFDVYNIFAGTLWSQNRLPVREVALLVGDHVKELPEGNTAELEDGIARIMFTRPMLQYVWLETPSRDGKLDIPARRALATLNLMPDWIVEQAVVKGFIIHMESGRVADEDSLVAVLPSGMADFIEKHLPLIRKFQESGRPLDWKIPPEEIPKFFNPPPRVFLNTAILRPMRLRISGEKDPDSHIRTMMLQELAFPLFETDPEGKLLPLGVSLIGPYHPDG